MTGLQIALSRELAGWPLYTIIIALGQMLSATSFQLTLLSGRNWADDVQLYILSAVFFAASAVWYPMFRLKPSVYVLSIPWVFFGLAFFLVGLPTIHEALHPSHKIISNLATWCYAVASAAGFLFFGLNFGEEAVRVFCLSRCEGLTDDPMSIRVLPRKSGRCVLVLCKAPNRSGSPLSGTGVTR